MAPAGDRFHTIAMAKRKLHSDTNITTSRLVLAATEDVHIPRCLIPVGATPVGDAEARILAAWALGAHRGGIESVLWRGRLLHDGWDLDNAAWVVGLEDGSVAGVTTSHGVPVEWTLEDAQVKLDGTLASADGIRVAMRLMGGA